MVDHRMDGWLYMMSAVTAMTPLHDHLLMKDPLRLGWCCRLAGCGFFKPADEFDGITVLPCAA
ncbi:hypothetical protein ACKI14_02650 [Streptomyces turgidiscabies]|uniref:hypothetical protein n=1 Tax=Streptomyces turgidiscabies TaxID=85558 RepID=UPI0038F8140E